MVWALPYLAYLARLLNRTVALQLSLASPRLDHVLAAIGVAVFLAAFVEFAGIERPAIRSHCAVVERLMDRPADCTALACLTAVDFGHQMLAQLVLEPATDCHYKASTRLQHRDRVYQDSAGGTVQVGFAALVHLDRKVYDIGQGVALAGHMVVVVAVAAGTGCAWVAEVAAAYSRGKCIAGVAALQRVVGDAETRLAIERTGLVEEVVVAVVFVVVEPLDSPAHRNLDQL